MKRMQRMCDNSYETSKSIVDEYVQQTSVGYCTAVCLCHIKPTIKECHWALMGSGDPVRPIEINVNLVH